MFTTPCAQVTHKVPRYAKKKKVIPKYNQINIKSAELCEESAELCEDS